MAVNAIGERSGLKARAVGLPHGAVSTVARVCKRSVPYVWKVATGSKYGNPAIRRQLAKRGWQDPNAGSPVSNADLNATLRAVYGEPAA